MQEDTLNYKLDGCPNQIDHKYDTKYFNQDLMENNEKQILLTLNKNKFQDFYQNSAMSPCTWLKQTLNFTLKMS